MFACHLHNSSGMCLHLSRTNHIHVSAESPSKSPLTPQKKLKKLKKPKKNLKTRPQGARGGGKKFKNFFFIHFLPKTGNFKPFSFFFFFFKKKINCGHYVCLPSTKIVVTMFACHLHSSDQSCVCRVTFKHLPQPLRSHIQSFGTIFSTKKT